MIIDFEQGVFNVLPIKGQMGLNWLGLPVSLTLTQTPQFGAVVKFQMRYLHVDEKLPQVARRHHDGGVELDHVALVQSDVVVGGQALENKAGSVTEHQEPESE